MAYRLASIIGSRPEIVQAAPLSLAYRDCVEEILVHTGQHYDPEMSELQIADLRLPVPDYNLGVGSLPNDEPGCASPSSGSARSSTASAPTPSWSGATPTRPLPARAPPSPPGCPLLHVEAGLRSYRADMPEERNRIETDRLSDVLFAPCEHARDVLRREGVPRHRPRDRRPARRRPARHPGTASRERRGGDYVLATVHRNYNTDTPERLGAVLACLAEARSVASSSRCTRAPGKRIAAWGLEVPANVEVREPVTYTEMLALERDANAIATDSGGVQREAYLWGVPCITLREETEWIETVADGLEHPGRRPTRRRSAPRWRSPAPSSAPDLRRRQRRGADRRADRRHPRSALEERCLTQLSVGVIGLRPDGRLPRSKPAAARVCAPRRRGRPRRERAPARGRRDRAIAGYADWRDLIEREARELDAVSIACRSELHAEMALEALDAGLHVLVEKPIATTLPDALRMRGAAMRGRAQADGRPRRALQPGGRKLRELVAEGRLGRVFRAHATRVGPLPSRIQDAGVAIDLATHDLDMMQHVLGATITRDLRRRRAASCTTAGGHARLPAALRRGRPRSGLLDVNWLTPGEDAARSR